MARILAVATLLLTFTSHSVCAKEWARKMFKETNHEFGTVARGAKSEYRFEFQNIYKEDVHVAGVRASCGCATPSIEKDSLKTWEKGAILVKYNTRTFLGKRGATITLTIDKPYFAEVQLTITGFIRGDITFNPGTANFGSIDQGVAANTSVELSHAGRSDWKINDVRSSNPHFEVTMEEAERSENRVKYRLNVVLKEDAPVGYIQDQLTIVTSDSDMARVVLPVEGRVVSALTLSPQSLFLGVLQPGEAVTKNLIVRGKKPFKIMAVECEDECFAFKVDGEVEKGLHVVPVTFTAGEKPGKVTQKIQIRSSTGLTANCLATATVKGEEREQE